MGHGIGLECSRAMNCSCCSTFVSQFRDVASSFFRPSGSIFGISFVFVSMVTSPEALRAPPRPRARGPAGAGPPGRCSRTRALFGFGAHRRTLPRMAFEKPARRRRASLRSPRRHVGTRAIGIGKTGESVHRFAQVRAAVHMPVHCLVGTVDRLAGFHGAYRTGGAGGGELLSRLGEPLVSIAVVPAIAFTVSGMRGVLMGECGRSRRPGWLRSGSRVPRSSRSRPCPRTWGPPR